HRRAHGARRNRSRGEDLRLCVHESACGLGMDQWPQRADGPSLGRRCPLGKGGPQVGALIETPGPPCPSYACLTLGGRMSKITAILGSALFFFVAPAMLAGVIPWLITHWEFRPPFLAVEATRLAGVAFIIVGVPGLLDSFARFALEGLGTPAPIAPPRNLVVSGLYRYVRNPIYVAVVAVILGQAVLFADWHLLGYGALIWLFFHIVVIAYEEPTLRQSYGAEYESYRANVPRWLPRLTPWRAV